MYGFSARQVVQKNSGLFCGTQGTRSRIGGGRLLLPLRLLKGAADLLAGNDSLHENEEVVLAGESLVWAIAGRLNSDCQSKNLGGSLCSASRESRFTFDFFLLATGFLLDFMGVRLWVVFVQLGNSACRTCPRLFANHIKKQDPKLTEEYTSFPFFLESKFHSLGPSSVCIGRLKTFNNGLSTSNRQCYFYFLQ